MAILPAYDPKSLAFSWGEIMLEGLGPEDAFNITPNADITSTSVGIDGFRAPTLISDYTCNVSLTLQQTSLVNQKLAWVVEEQRRRRKLFVMDFSMNDKSGSNHCLLKQAYLQAGPEQPFGAEVGTRTWVWNAELVYDHLGSGITIDGDIFASFEAEINAAIALIVGA